MVSRTGTLPPGSSEKPVYFRYLFAYDSDAMDKQKENGALLIAACIVAAVRLRGEPIRPSPKLTATISDSVQLARLVLNELQR